MFSVLKKKETLIFIGIVVCLFIIVLFADKGNKESRMVKETKESDIVGDKKVDVVNEEQEIEYVVENKTVKEMVENRLGKDVNLLNRSEFEKYLFKIKGEGLDYLDRLDRIEEDLGIFNRLAYEYDLVIEHDDEVFTMSQVLNTLLYYYFTEGDVTLEDLKDVKMVRSSNVMGYDNSLQEDEPRNKKEYYSVIDTYSDSYLLIGATDGFNEGNTKGIRTGYPVVYSDPLYSGLNEEMENAMGLSVGVYVEEDMKMSEFVKKVEELDVSVGDYQTHLQGSRNRDELKQYNLNGRKFRGYETDTEETYREYMDIELDIMPYSYLYTGNIGVYEVEKGIDITNSMSEEWVASDKDVEGLREYVESINKDKYIQGNTMVRVDYEIDKRAIVREFDFIEEETRDYYEKDGNEPPIIKIDGEEIKLQLVTEDLTGHNGVRYKVEGEDR